MLQDDSPNLCRRFDIHRSHGTHAALTPVTNSRMQAAAPGVPAKCVRTIGQERHHRESGAKSANCCLPCASVIRGGYAPVLSDMSSVQTSRP